MTISWLITGANGNLGKRLIASLLEDPDNQVTALVRSARARSAIEELSLDEAQVQRLQIEELSYTNVTELRRAAKDCHRAVHLVGILKETSTASYRDAHEDSTAALLEALTGTSVIHLTYMSIVGSSSSADNSCLASKGRAEDLCTQNALASCVLRVPMVLGEGDYASYALRARATRKLSFTFRAASLEQPIYAGDVVTAIIAASSRQIDGSLDLGGPEILDRRALTARAARLLGGDGSVVSLPLGLGKAMAAVLGLVSANPPFTTAMLEVLDHDDGVDAAPALQALGLTQLTGLDDMLQKVLVQ